MKPHLIGKPYKCDKCGEAGESFSHCGMAECDAESTFSRVMAETDFGSTLPRVWWVVRDKNGCDAAYNTLHDAVEAYRTWWTKEWPEFAPYRVVRCEVHETEVDPIGMEVDNEP